MLSYLRKLVESGRSTKVMEQVLELASKGDHVVVYFDDCSQVEWCVGRYKKLLSDFPNLKFDFLKGSDSVKKDFVEYSVNHDCFVDDVFVFFDLSLLGALYGADFRRLNPEAFDKEHPIYTYQPLYSCESENKYNRTIKDKNGNQITVDVYDVLKAFNVQCPALQHLAKKALCAGLRGHKSLKTDLEDIRASADRAIELNSVETIGDKVMQVREDNNE